MNCKIAAFFAAIVFCLPFFYASSQPFVSHISKNASFYASDFLNASTIASYTGKVNVDNICLSLGRFGTDPDWFIDVDGKNIKFLGNGDREISFIVVCDKGTNIIKTIENHPSTKMSPSYIAHCGQFYTNLSEVKCAVILNSVAAVSEEAFPLSYVILIAFSILLVWLMVIVLTTGNSLLKLIYLVKLGIFVVVLLLFTFFGSKESFVFNLVLLFFFFVQTNLSLSPFLLGLLDLEKKHIKLANFAIMGIEFTLVIFMLVLIWKSGILG